MQNQIPITNKIKTIKLEKMPTLIKEFMVDRTPRNKNFGQLLKIFNSCYKSFSPDPSNDLRILKYVEDMKSGEWNDLIIITFQNGQAIDGVHRGIAYLKCVKEGSKEDTLPQIYLSRVK